jgi:hypothetical protein
MPARPEMTVDHAVCREEPLRLGRGLEPLHLPLSSPRRPVRIFNTIIQVSAHPVPEIVQFPIEAGRVLNETATR